ncbi:hypothetical protein FRB97_006623 [Tulasnella sp. 331]|nr:hypothetical protein FRB97_006623 [Tulasnella sp. 331]
MTSLGANDRELTTQQNKLKEDSIYLGPLKANIDHALHIVSAVLGRGSNVDDISMKDVNTSIKGLVSTLKNDDDFMGLLATTNEQGWAELNKKVQAMRAAS